MILVLPGSTKAQTSQQQVKQEPKVKPGKKNCHKEKRAIRYYKRWTHSWQKKRQAERLAGATKVKGHSCVHVRAAAKEWRLRSIAARKTYKRWKKEQIRIAKDQATRQARNLYAKWECIHLHEGAWNDPNGPYYGGLQMDISFQQAYGPEFYRRYGTADHWPVWAQLTAAERAFKSRGFNPWPNTARACGLL